MMPCIVCHKADRVRFVPVTNPENRSASLYCGRCRQWFGDPQIVMKMAAL